MFSITMISTGRPEYALPRMERQLATNPPQAIIFDVDGLIVDTEDIYYRTFADTLQAHGGGLARAGYSPT